MRIIVDNYVLESHSEGGYDLLEKKIANRIDKKTRKPTGETYEKEETLGYNMSLENCIKRIINLNLHRIDNNVDLRSFLELYRGEKSRVESLVQMGV